MTHIYETKVFYEDTDLGAIVYHANYLKFIERARSEFVDELGIDQNELLAEGLIFVVRHIECDYLASAKLFDRLQITTQILNIGGASLTFSQHVNCNGKLLFKARVTVVLITTEGKPYRMPAKWRDMFSQAEF